MFLSNPAVVLLASAFLVLIAIGDSNSGNGIGGTVFPGAHAFQQVIAARRTMTTDYNAPTLFKSSLSKSSSSSSKKKMGMAPRFDKESQTWFVTDPETEGPSAGYNLLGSLYRAGPVPVFQRIFNPTSYEQAVLKYMAKEQCSRIEAMGNMDAYLENPQDWMYQKMCEREKGAAVRDYANANMDPKQIVLSTMWAVVVVVFGYDLVTGVMEGRYGAGEGNTNTLFHGNLWSLPL